MAQRFAINKTAVLLPAFSVLLFAVNAYICLELFRIEYLAHMGSIEGLFITLARYARDHWGDLAWFPLWYNGIPFQNTYPPLLPLLVSGVSAVSGWSPALAYHATVAFLYCAGPVFLFWLCYRLSRSRVVSFFAGLIASVVTPSAFVIADEYRQIGSFLRPRRLQNLVLYGEGPHITGLALLPLAILALDFAIEKRRPQYYVLAALACAATMLTNWLAAAALCIAVGSYVLAFSTSFHRRIITAASVGVLAYAFAAPWIPLSTIRTFQFNSQTIEGDFRMYATLLPFRLLVLIVVLLVIKLALTKLHVPPTVQFALYFSLVTAAIAVAWEYARIAVVPQPHRYNTELALALSILIPFALEPLFARAPSKLQIAAASICLAGAIPFVIESRRYARTILLKPVDITQRIEYKSARWVDQNLQGRRIFAPGSIMFWMNVFTDTAQIGGADEQGATNFQSRVAYYIITTGKLTGNRDAEISLAWLNVLGADAIEVGGPQSTQAYKSFLNPAKFNGILKELWRDGDDAIYAVPRAQPSLAHVMRASDLVQRTPIHGLDVDPLKPYLAALNSTSAPAADFRWTSQHSAEIHANLQRDQIVLVQQTYHAGWKATVAGRTIPVTPDPLSQMVLTPSCNGPCTIELSYDGGTEMLAARTACWLAFAASAVWIVIGNRFRGPASM